MAGASPLECFAPPVFVAHVSIEALTNAGIKPDQLPSVIQELTKAPSYSAIIRWAFTSEGAMAIIEIASGVDFSESTDHDTLTYLALDLMGIEYGTEEVGSSGSIPFSQTLEETGT